MTVSTQDKLLDINVTVMKKSLSLKATQAQSVMLEKAADLVNDTMNNLARKDSGIGIEKIAMLAAINIAYDLLTAEYSNDKHLQSIHQKIESMQSKIDSHIQASQDLNL